MADLDILKPAPIHVSCISLLDPALPFALLDTVLIKVVANAKCPFCHGCWCASLEYKVEGVLLVEKVVNARGVGHAQRPDRG